MQHHVYLLVNLEGPVVGALLVEDEVTDESMQDNIESKRVRGWHCFGSLLDDKYKYNRIQESMNH